MIKIVISSLIVFLLTSCATSQQSKNIVELGDKKSNPTIIIRKKQIIGNAEQVEWLRVHFKETINNIKVTEKAKNYSMNIDILVANKTVDGKYWDLNDRYPDLKLYINYNNKYTLLGKKNNSQELSVKRLLVLSKKSIIDLKLADEEVYRTDDETGTKDSPIARIRFNFMGQGKYLYFSGGAIFVITFKEL